MLSHLFFSFAENGRGIVFISNFDIEVFQLSHSKCAKLKTGVELARRNESNEELQSYSVIGANAYRTNFFNWF
jgi:hypothetical protein